MQKVNIESDSRGVSYKDFLTSLVKYNIAYVVVAVINVILVFILTRLFSVTDYAYISLFTAASSFIRGLFALGLSDGYTRFFNSGIENVSEIELRKRTIYIPLFLTILAGAVSVFLFPDFVGNMTIGYSGRKALTLLFINSFLTYFFAFVAIYYRMRLDVRRYTRIQIASSFCAKAGVVLALFGTITYDTLSFCLTMGSLILFVVFISLYKLKNHVRNTEIKNSKKNLRIFYKYSLLSWPITLIMYANQFLVQNTIHHSLGTYSLGIYSSLYFFTGIITMTKGGFSSYWSPFVFRYYKTEQKKIQEIHDAMMFFMLTILCTTTGLRFILFRFIGREFRAGSSIFTFVIANSVLMFLVETTGYGCNLSNKPYIISIVSAVSMLLNVLGIHIFSNSSGMLSIGVSCLVSGVVYFAFCSYFGNRHYKMIISPVRTCIAVIIIVILSFTNYFIRDSVLNLIVSLMIMLCTVVLYRKQIKKFLDYVDGRVILSSLVNRRK